MVGFGLVMVGLVMVWLWLVMVGFGLAGRFFGNRFCWLDFGWPEFERRDRKSTRLNSSHLVISYAVFCLKKKKHRAFMQLVTPVRPFPLRYGGLCPRRVSSSPPSLTGMIQLFFF